MKHLMDETAQTRTPATRRTVLKGAAGSALFFGVGLGAGRAALAAPGAVPLEARPKFVMVLLRGGLDGLHLLPAYGDPAYAPARRGIAIAPPSDAGGALKLDGLFGLHPSMPGAYRLYQDGQLAFIHAIASPYRHRSHFSAQSILENGTNGRATKDGWLARALNMRRGGDTRIRLEALSFGSSLEPLTIHGAPTTAAWSPGDPNMNTRTKDALASLFASDPLFEKSVPFIAGLDALSAIAPDQINGQRAQEWPALARSAGRLLAAPTGPDAAVIDLGGWDSHAYQGGADGNLGALTKHLDGALVALKDGLGQTWADTVVVVLTEFGRTIEVNGTGGTDHGIAGAAMLMGGRVRGGRIIADWPGLAPKDRFEGRDLRPTLDTRAVLKGILRDHWGLPEDVLAVSVFPESSDITPTSNLLIG